MFPKLLPTVPFATDNRLALLLEQNPAGTLVHPGRLNVTQREILQQLDLPTPAQTLREKLPRAPA